MQRYFVDAKQIQGDTIIIDNDDAHHIVRVMRMSEGSEVIVSDSIARTVKARIDHIAGKSVTLSVVAELPQQAEATWRVTIAQGLPKGDKMELIMQKCTEIGAAGFIPFSSERVIVQYDHKKEAKRLERWSKIVKEAAEQSHRDCIPTLAEPKSWKELLALIPSYDLTLFCYERAGDEGHGIGLKDALNKFKQADNANTNVIQPSILLIAGPEGGFAEREAAEAEAAGAILIGLGKRILRAETAGIVGLSCILYESGEMGGV